MTPKEAYEARKAERKARLSNSANAGWRDHDAEDEEAMMLAERAVNALETIAASLAALSQPQAPGSDQTEGGA